MNATPVDSSGAARMKFGAHMYLWTPLWADKELGLLDHVRSLNLELFEVSLGDDARFTPSLLCRRAEELGLALTIGPGGVWPMECDISDDDPHHRALGLAWHRHMIDLAAESGAGAYCGALYGHPGKVLRRRPPPDELPRTAENLHLLADYADRVGVRLVIEPMSKFRTHLVTTPEQAVRLVQTASHPNLAVTLDTYHMVTEVRDYGAAIRAVGPLLWGLHACENDRGVPGGGLVPWKAVFEALVAVCPTANVMLETYNTDLPDFAFSRGLFQNLCPDADAFVRQGIGFLKRCAEEAARN
jgi:D-psicose/D-tagatose/L-ribulose 3-epimerase